MGTVKYNSTVKTSNGREYTVEIHDMDYAGSPTEVTLGAGGFITTWEGQGSDGPYVSNLYTSSTSVSIHCINDTILNYLLTLVQQPEKIAFIVVLQGSDVVWGGRVLADLGSYPYEDTPFFTLTATDGLKTLESLDFTPDNLSLTSDWYSLEVILKNIFLRVFPTANYFFKGPLEIWTYAQVLDEVSESAAVNRASLIQINIAAFMMELDKPLSYWEVLDMICNTFGLRLIYSNGSYHLWQWKVFDQFDAVTVNYFDESGYVGTTTIDTTQLITPATDDRLWVNGAPGVSFLSMLKKASIEYTAPNTVGPDAWESPDGVAVYLADPVATFASIYPPVIHVPFTGYGSVDTLKIQGGVGTKLKIVFDIDIKPELALKANVIYVVVNCRNSNNFAQIQRLTNVDGSWQTFDTATLSPNQVQWVSLDINEFYMIMNPGVGKNRFEIITPDLPFDLNDFAVNIYVGTNYDYKFTCTRTLGSYAVKTQVSTLALPVTLEFNGPGNTGWLGIYALSPAQKYTLRTFAVSPSTQTNQLYYFINPANAIIIGDEQYVSVNCELKLVTDDAENSQDGYQYTAENSEELSDIVELPDTFIGDLINGRTQQAIKVYDGADWIYSSMWSTGVLNDVAAPLLEKLVEFLALQRSTAIEIWGGDVAAFGNAVELYVHYTLVKPGKTYIFNGGTWTADTDEISGEWLAWENMDPSLNIVVNPSDPVKDRNGNDVVIGFMTGVYDMASGGITTGAGHMRQTIQEVREFARSNSFDEIPIHIESGASPTLDGASGHIIMLVNGEVYLHDGVDWVLMMTNMTTATGLSNVLTSGNIFVGDVSNVATGVTLTLSATTGTFGLSNAGVLTMPDANASTRGLMNTGSQTFNGAKVIEYNNGINSGTTDIVLSPRRSSSGSGVILGYYSRNVSSADAAFIGANSAASYLAFGKANTIYAYFDAAGKLSISATVGGTTFDTLSSFHLSGAIQMTTSGAAYATSANNCYVFASSVITGGSAGDLIIQSRPVAGKAIGLVTGSTPTLRMKVTDSGVEVVSGYLRASAGAISAYGSANNKGDINRVLYRNTTNATATELTTDGAAGSGATNRIAVPTNGAMSVMLNICGKKTLTGDAWQMLRQFVITNNGGTTALQGAVTVLGTDIGSAALNTSTCTITANDTDDCIDIKVSGVAATNIRWTAYIVSCEVIY